MRNDNSVVFSSMITDVDLVPRKDTSQSRCCFLPMMDLPPARKENYSHSYFRNGFRHNVIERKETENPNVLSFETGSFGLEFDMANLSSVRYGLLNPDVSYLEAIEKENSDRLKDISTGELVLKLSRDGCDYVATTCDSTFEKGIKPFNNHVILWEAGKIAQHVEILGLRFEPVEGDHSGFELKASLDIVVWPDSFSLTLKVELNEDESWAGLSAYVGLNDWSIQKSFTNGGDNTNKNVSLVCDVDAHRNLVKSDVELELAVKDITSIPVEFSDHYDCFKCTADFGRGKIRRKFRGGYTDVRDYDEFIVTVTNRSTEDLYVPYVLHLKEPANITGLCPMVCKTDGTPTGIPIQLSKNWHNPVLRPYGYFYTMLPVQAKSTADYMIRVVYGFYGELPSASHAQLSLQGNTSATGRWEQLAVGCFGETICMDPETTAGIQIRITDARGLMFRNGLDGKQWGWTACGWGGDWLKVYQPGPHRNNVLQITGMKTAYVAHGPCLTDVRYAGYFGEKRQVGFTVRVRTIRTDDYARTIFTLDYKIHDTVTLGEDGYLHMLYNNGFETPTIAWGGRGNLQSQRTVPNGLQHNHVYVKGEPLDGGFPSWVSFTDSVQFEPAPERKNKNKMPGGTKHMIIRNFEADVGDETLQTPHVSFTNSNYRQQVWVQDDKPSLFASIDLGPEVRTLESGDYVRMEVEWMTTTLVAEDYYGPNRNFGAHLGLHPKSWRTPMREAVHNGVLLRVSVEGGTVQQNYPLSIAAKDPVVTANIAAGLGGFPMEFTGLPHTDYSLYKVVDDEEVLFDQSVHGNDYWQTEYDTVDQTFTMTFNPSLGSDLKATFRLK